MKKEILKRKLELLSQLSCNDVVNISENGNYWIYTQKWTWNSPVIKHTVKNVTKKTICKIGNQTIIGKSSTYEVGYIVMVTKTGRVLVGLPFRNRFGFTKYQFKNVSVNYKNFSIFSNSIREDLFLQLLYVNKKSSYILQYPNLNNFAIFKQFKNISEVRKYFGYTFISLDTFIKVFITSSVSGGVSILVSSYNLTISNKKKLVILLLSYPALCVYSKQVISDILSLAGLQDDIEPKLKLIITKYCITDNDIDHESEDDLPF